MIYYVNNGCCFQLFYNIVSGNEKYYKKVDKIYTNIMNMNDHQLFYNIVSGNDKKVDKIYTNTMNMNDHQLFYNIVSDNEKYCEWQ